MTEAGARSPAADPPPELVARFREALDRLWPEGGRLGLAVSGGPDSMAMLLLAEAAISGQFEVATVDHGLRQEAPAECALVERACADRGIPCAVLTVEVGEGNLQARAREARYIALGSWAEKRNLPAIATAHHADDQAETLLMRLNRGSGVSGLAGVREHSWLYDLSYDAAVIRPLLSFRRRELEDIVDSSGIEVVRDPSNLDERFDRVRIRKALAEADWLDPLAISRSASHLAEAHEALEHMTNAAVRQYVTRHHDRVECHPPPDRAIAFRMVDRIIQWLGGSARGGDIARLLDRLERCEGGNVGGVHATVKGKWGEAESPRWIFRSEPPRRSG
jgi:tRNA(Ile)-lysidine synthase